MRQKVHLEPFLYESCEVLAKKFQELESSNDVAELLRIPYRYLVYHIYRISADNKYKTFHIPKKSGGYRTIYSPNNSLRIVQRKLSQVLYAVYRSKPSVHGFAPSRSIITNAQAHVKKKFILNIDIKNFFDSINFGRVRGLFMRNPYKLNDKVATVLAQICCFDNKLPQGAPTSPIVSNLICTKMDSELQRFSRKHGLFYTRYADDITFSSNRNKIPNSLIYSYQKGCSKVILGDEIKSIIEQNGFKINDKKVRLLDKTQRQEVTGLIVNQTVNVNRKYIRNINATLHAWKKYGLKSVSATYIAKYAKKRTLPNKPAAKFLDSLNGKIEFVGSVRGKEDLLYQKLLSKFNHLKSKEVDNLNTIDTEDK